MDCSLTLGGRSADIPTAMALASDGSVFITGITYSDNFPVTPAAYQTQLSQHFLLRADPCQRAISAATFLPSTLNTTDLLIGMDGSVYMGAYETSGDGSSMILRFDADLRKLVAQIKINGIASRLATDTGPYLCNRCAAL